MIETMVDQLLHRWLRIPYTLNVHYHRKPKNPRATVLFIHGLGNSGDAWRDVISKLPRDIQIISIDLLGFGRSPRPSWALYDAKTQANSVLATYLKLRLTSQVIVVGHSMGSLVAIEMAKRYPLLINSLILCSPPLYDSTTSNTLLPKSDRLLRELYMAVQQRPDDFVRLSAFAMKYNLVNKSFHVTTDTIASYMAALKASIVNQTSYADAYTVTVPTTIIRGSLDPFVVTRNLKRLAKTNSNIQMKSVIAGHEIKGLFVPAVVATITTHLPTKTNDT
ncbi:MAG: alpha/beta hydrolase [Candidatus Saccharimonadales bacterium]